MMAMQRVQFCAAQDVWQYMNPLKEIIIWLAGAASIAVSVIVGYFVLGPALG